MVDPNLRERDQSTQAEAIRQSRRQSATEKDSKQLLLVAPSLGCVVSEAYRTRREWVSHALKRRATLEAIRNPAALISGFDPCDADPLLIRSALHHGEPTDRECPVCVGPRLTLLHYVFGDQLGQYSGRIKAIPDLVAMEQEYGEFKVCVVEVCPDCGWNHMIETFLLGDGLRRRPPRRRQTVEDIYG